MPAPDEPLTDLPLETAANNSTTRLASRALVVIGLGLAAATIWNFSDAIVDDAFISLRYARNLLEGNGLVFNPGEYVEGITNLGHVLTVAALGWLGLDLTWAARLVGLTGGLAAAIFAPAALLPSPGQQPERSIARLLLLANFSFVFMSVTGLETVFYTGILCLACYAFERNERRIDWRTGLLLAALFSVRPDGAIMGAVLVGLALFRHGPRQLLRSEGVWIWVLGIAAVEIFRFSYYGAWVPNTALVKGPGGSFAPTTLPWYGAIGDDLVEMLAQTGGATSVLFALVAIVFHRRREAIQLAVPISAAALAFEAYAGGDWMLGYRFLLPALPFYLCLVAMGMMECLRALVQRRPEEGLVFVGAAWVGILIVAINCWSSGLEFLQRQNQYPYSYMTSKRMTEAGRWIGSHYPETYQLQAGSVGALGFFSRVVIIDTLGLTDRTIAKTGPDRERRDAYLRERNPELVILTGTSREPPETTREIHGRPYGLAQSFPMGENYWWLFVREDARLP